MGRRARDHCYVKYIIIMNKNGQVDQRLELDETGRLLSPVTRTPIQRTTEFVQPPVNFSPAYIAEQIQSIPLPPSMRSKPTSALLSVLQTFRNYVPPQRSLPEAPVIDMESRLPPFPLDLTRQPVLVQ